MKNRFSLIVLLLVLVASLLAGVTCGYSKTEDFVVTSTESEGHTHQITIIGDDVDTLRGERTLTTTEAGDPPHTHTVKIVSFQFEQLKKGYELVVSSSWVDADDYPDYPVDDKDHTHKYYIKK